jgi:integrase
MYNIILSFFDGTEAKMADDTIEILPAIYNEMQVVLKTRDGREIKYIRPDEVRNMLSFLEGRDRVFVDLPWNTGARVSEALMVTPGRINFERSTITITTLKKRKTLPPKGKALRNEIRGLELALEHDASSKIIQRKLKQAREMLSQIKKEPPPPSYRTMPLQPEFAGKLAALHGEVLGCQGGNLSCKPDQGVSDCAERCRKSRDRKTKEASACI